MRFRGVVVLFGALVAWPAAAPAAPKRPITETDLYAFQWVAAPQISPDGRQAAYVLVTVNEKHDGYDTSLWIVPTSAAAAPRRLTAGPRDSAPRWSPDGRTLAFLRSPGEKEKPQIFLLPLDGGEARALTDLPGGASTPVWSPSGKAIAFTSGTNAEDLEAQRLAKEKDKPAPKADKSDVHVVTRAVFRQNGEGWLDFTRPDHVWTVPVTAGADGPGQARQITSGVFIEADPIWSADGSAILFRSDRNLEPYYDPPDANLYSVPAAGGPIETVADIAGPIQQAVPAPDGKSFALIGIRESAAGPVLHALGCPPLRGRKGRRPDRRRRFHDRQRGHRRPAPAARRQPNAPRVDAGRTVRPSRDDAPRPVEPRSPGRRDPQDRAFDRRESRGLRDLGDAGRIEDGSRRSETRRTWATSTPSTSRRAGSPS